MSNGRVEIPSFPTGERLEVGDKVRLESGQIIKAEAIVITRTGVVISTRDLAADGKTLFSVGEELGSPDDDSRDALDEDAALGVNEYLRRRAIDCDGMSQSEKYRAMIDDIRQRERRLTEAFDKTY